MKRKRTLTGRIRGAKRVASMAKAAQALELRKAGCSYRQIKDKLNYRAVSTAADAVKSALDYVLREPAEEVRTLEAARLDALLMAVWPAAVKGDHQAIDRALKIMDRRARLFGLDLHKPMIEINRWVALLQRFDFSQLSEEQLIEIEAGRDPVEFGIGTTTDSGEV